MLIHYRDRTSILGASLIDATLTQCCFRSETETESYSNGAGLLVWLDKKELLLDVFNELLDSVIIDVASESHRIAKLGLDCNLDQEEEELRLSLEARARASDPSHSGEANGKYIVDIFGQTHPPIANEIFECMNCGRSIMAGRFAPHLEKCMGKGRKARLKSTRSTTAGQNRYSRVGPLSNHSPYSNPTTTNHLYNGSCASAGHEYANGALDKP
ncbi:SAGA-associated factor 11 [Striga asiatica]|uniref:SAGA-associated factor 11 n=1 Tax=Striga asiatica TaxID=4170 RepID=A0A5A7QGU1_STRAF|nr:SAGA-associated factor 11 [Striga asiatica]